MKILAIDPGYERVGIAILEKQDGKEVLLHSDCFKTDAKDEFPNRLAQIGHEIESVIQKFSPHALAIETLLFNSNQKTAMKVAEARGAIICIAKMRDLEIHEYTPLQIKNAITGYGRADKSQVEMMTRQLVEIKKEKIIDDEIDAIATGLTALASIRFN
ncbi:crossover junction endodeoxyribonuclease RuvC [Patescibacteria group bacterium]